MDRIDILVMSKGVDQLLKDNDIDPYCVVAWLVDEGLIDLDDYFEEEETDND